MISGIVTAVLVLAFVALAAWAWHPARRARFDDAAKLPLRDELPPCCGKEAAK